MSKTVQETFKGFCCRAGFGLLLMGDELRQKMGTMKKASKRESSWVIRSINFTASEAKIYDRLKGDRSARGFIMSLLRLEKRERLKRA